MLHAVIMAGGAGTRFWPASRNALPKQLLTLVGERTMIQATVERLGNLVPSERVRVVTSARLVDAIRQQLPQLPPAAIVGEPCKRDTAPCIGLAALMVSQQDREATMLVMPSDHVIQQSTAFQAAVRQAVELVDAAPRRIVTFGIRPTFASESFGYIERGEQLVTGTESSGRSGLAPAYAVARFREKPKKHVAQEYLATGKFYWNSGIFVWRAATILDALREHQPDMLEHLTRIGSALGRPDFPAVFEREFAAIHGISIDFAVMEQAPDVAVIEAPFDWDDVGNWQSIARLQGTDADGNTVSGKHLGLRTRGTIVRSTDDHLVVTLGLADCIVVHTPDATLVANKHDEEAIRDLVKMIEQRQWQQYL